MMRVRLTISVLLLMVAACAPRPAPTPVAPSRALDSTLRAGPAIESLAVTRERAGLAMVAFFASCPALLRREDQSGLTRAADWQAACSAQPGRDYLGPGDFLSRYFETVEVAGGDGFVTGYFEPQIAGVRDRQPGFDYPVFGVPDDLVRQGDHSGDGRVPLGRYDASGQFVPYYDRAAIEGGALAGRGLEIAWVADPIDFFFLQIQGSGRLLAPDGTVMRIGYAGQNGREYVAIGRILRERGIFAAGEATMDAIVAWLRAHPDEGRALMQENKSWVFFRELKAGAEGGGPIGSLGVPVWPRATVAADPRFAPLGGMVWLDGTDDSLDGLWVAQDTGGAIKGANRFDSFWGAGDKAKVTAGAMSSDARALLLVPKGTLARIGVAP